MQFSDTTNKDGIIQTCEEYCGFGDAGISGDAVWLKKFTGYINNAYWKAWTIILAAQNGWDLDDPNLDDEDFIKTYNLVATEQYIDLDIQANKILRMKSVRVQYDTNGAWYKAELINESELGQPTDTTTIARQFIKTRPKYNQVGRLLGLWPIPDTSVTSGLSIQFDREFDPFVSTDTVQVPGFDTPYHDIIPLIASLKWLKVNNSDSPKIASLERDLLKEEARLMQYYGNKNQDKKQTMKAAFIDYE